MPVSLDDLKLHLRITNTDFDEQLKIYLEAAIAACENHTNLIIWKSTVSFSYDYRPEYRLPVIPVISITSVKVDGNEITDKEYRLKDDVLIVDHKGDKVEVKMVAGYDDTPGDIKAAILLKAGRIFVNPADSVENLPSSSQMLLQPYRKINI